MMSHPRKRKRRRLARAFTGGLVRVIRQAPGLPEVGTEFESERTDSMVNLIRAGFCLPVGIEGLPSDLSGARSHARYALRKELEAREDESTPESPDGGVGDGAPASESAPAGEGDRDPEEALPALPPMETLEELGYRDLQQVLKACGVKMPAGSKHGELLDLARAAQGGLSS